MTAYSILDLSPILRGGDAAQALGNSLDLARHAEQWGYTRYWVAEHHNMPGVASAATSVVIGHIAAGTQRIRVGSGGVRELVDERLHHERHPVAPWRSQHARGNVERDE